MSFVASPCEGAQRKKANYPIKILILNGQERKRRVKRWWRRREKKHSSRAVLVGVGDWNHPSFHFSAWATTAINIIFFYCKTNTLTNIFKASLSYWQHTDNYLDWWLAFLNSPLIWRKKGHTSWEFPLAGSDDTEQRPRVLEDIKVVPGMDGFYDL